MAGITTTTRHSTYHVGTAAIDEATMQLLCGALAEEALRLIAQEHETGTDPNGTSWVPNKSWKDFYGWGLQVLELTGTLMNSWRSVARSNGFTILNHTEYANVQDRGGKVGRGVVLPPRPMLPTSEELPPKWQAAFDAITKRILDEHIRRVLPGAEIID